MLKLEKRPDSPHWQITGTLRGQRVRQSTGTDSRSHAETILAQRTREILDRDVYGEAATATWAEAVNLYLDLGGEARYLEPLVQRWGAWRLAAITPLEIARAGREIYPGRQPSTLNRQLYTPVHAVLTEAARAGLCAVPKLTRPKQTQRTVDPAGDDWLRAVLAAPIRRTYAPGSSGERVHALARARLTALVLLMTLTGARISEAVDLTWRDVALDRGEALLRQTKNGDPRRIVLPDALRAALAALPRTSEGERALGYASRYTASQALARAARAAGAAKFSPHQAGRHAFAARLLADGATLKTVQEAGGWKSLAVVARYYGHLERAGVDQALHAAATRLTQPPPTAPAKVLQFKGKA